MVLDIFTKLCKIPHCSLNATAMREYLLSYAKELGYEASADEAGNVYAFKGEPNICLQSHYDMVCIGDAPNIELVQKDGFLSAKNSSLGADNGIGVAMMLKAMQERENLECLFTADEEVGLIGAGAFSRVLKAKYLLNLDSEDESEVIIGCAAGADIHFSVRASLKQLKAAKPLFELSVSGLPGGHSGLDIDKGIESAIKLLSQMLDSISCELVEIKGGERINSIPVSASAKLLCDDISALQALASKHKNVSLKALDASDVVLENSEQIIKLLSQLSHGVVQKNDELNMPNVSINLSTITQSQGEIEISSFARAMSDEGLDEIVKDEIKKASLLGFKTRISGRGQAWQPKQSEFSQMVLASLKEQVLSAKLAAIHAGLECGAILKGQDRLGHQMQAASMGPNIFNPHSKSERCEIKSVERIWLALNSILDKLKA